MWGIQDACLDVNNNAIAVSEFDDPARGAAAYSSIQTLSSFVLYMLASWLSVYHPIYILIILVINLIFAYITSFKFVFNQDMECHTLKSISGPDTAPMLEAKPDAEPHKTVEPLKATGEASSETLKAPVEAPIEPIKAPFEAPLEPATGTVEPLIEPNQNKPEGSTGPQA